VPGAQPAGETRESGLGQNSQDLDLRQSPGPGVGGNERTGTVAAFVRFLHTLEIDREKITLSEVDVLI
jgi:hypothetical protein